MGLSLPDLPKPVTMGQRIVSRYDGVRGRSLKGISGEEIRGILRFAQKDGLLPGGNRDEPPQILRVTFGDAQDDKAGVERHRGEEP
jgi:hypothetical protein